MADEYPSQMFVHLTGYKTNGNNFGKLMGAMENMKHPAACWRARAPRKTVRPRSAIWRRSPSPKSCAWATPLRWACADPPELHDGCALDGTPHDPVIEKDAAASLFDAGAYVVFHRRHARRWRCSDREEEVWRELRPGWQLHQGRLSHLVVSLSSRKKTGSTDVSIASI